VTTLQELLMQYIDGSSTSLATEIAAQSSSLAGLLAAQRQCLHMKDGSPTCTFDPRFVVFEYAFGLMLRPQQHALVRKFITAGQAGKSLCHQMIMGAGKTTIVGPILALVLANGDNLVIQVVPGPLLDFSAGVMREKFSSLIHKQVLSFRFDRHTHISAQLLRKLQVAKANRAIVISDPTSVKSFVLKFLEMLHIRESARLEKEQYRPKKVSRMAQFFGRKEKLLRPEYTQEQLDTMVHECAIAVQIYELFNNGILLLDEVDLILHPLKSELNWPLGDK